MDEFGPLNLMPHPGRQWAERGGKHKDPDREPRRRQQATYNRYGGVRHLFAALDLAKDKLYGHIKPIKKRTQFLEFCRYLRTLHPPQVRIAIVCDNFSPHLTTRKCQRVGTWAAANNVESPTHPPTVPGSTGSKPSSRPCAISPWMARTTPTTKSRAA
ncbi:hypothetical protein OHT74_40105 [Streptomyces sp. NBC_00354]